MSTSANSKLQSKLLISSVKKNDLQFAKHLLKKGADPNLLQDCGEAAFHLAAGLDDNNASLTTLFIEFGADPNVRSSEGTTPVHIAATYGSCEVLRLLLLNGGDPFIKDQDEKSAVDYAHEIGCSECLVLINTHILNLQFNDSETEYYVQKVECLETSGSSIWSNEESDGHLEDFRQSNGWNLKTHLLETDYKKRVNDIQTIVQNEDSVGGASTEDSSCGSFHTCPNESDHVIDDKISESNKSSSTENEDWNAINKSNKSKGEKKSSEYLYSWEDSKSNKSWNTTPSMESQYCSQPNTKAATWRDFRSAKTTPSTYCYPYSMANVSGSSKSSLPFEDSIMFLPQEGEMFSSRDLASTASCSDYSQEGNSEAITAVYEEEYSNRSEGNTENGLSSSRKHGANRDNEISQITKGLSQLVVQSKATIHEETSKVPTSKDESLSKRKITHNSKVTNEYLDNLSLFTDDYSTHTLEKAKRKSEKETDKNSAVYSWLMQSMQEEALPIDVNIDQNTSFKSSSTSSFDPQITSTRNSSMISQNEKNPHQILENHCQTNNRGYMRNHDFSSEIKKKNVKPEIISTFLDIPTKEFAENRRVLQLSPRKPQRKPQRKPSGACSVVSGTSKTSSLASTGSHLTLHIYKDQETSFALLETHIPPDGPLSDLPGLCSDIEFVESESGRSKSQSQIVVPVVTVDYFTSDDSGDATVLYTSSDNGNAEFKIPKHITQMSNQELRRKLVDLGDTPGPIVQTTRCIYEQRLAQILNDPDTTRLQEAAKKKVNYGREMCLVLSGDLDISHLQELEDEMCKPFLIPDQTRKWREGTMKTSFNYILMDSRITQNLPARAKMLGTKVAFEVFLESIIYIGKGKKGRPYAHFKEAIQSLQKDTKGSAKVEEILDIWDSGLGVVSLHVYHNVIPVEAYTREACMIQAIGLAKLTNIRAGDFYGPAASWSNKKKQQLGIRLLQKAYRIFLSEGERQIRPTDIKIGQ